MTRTIEVDEALISQALKMSELMSDREAVAEGLRLLISASEQARDRKLAEEMVFAPIIKALKERPLVIDVDAFGPERARGRAARHD